MPCVYSNAFIGKTVQATYKDISEFISLCEELEIVVGAKRNKTYSISLEKANTAMQSQDLH